METRESESIMPIKTNEALDGPAENPKRAAFVALVGRPSSGKSTLLNALCGQKVAIVSPVPQTTRNAVRGIVNREAGQLIFIDTPGRHASLKKLNKRLMEVGARALGEAELVLYLLDATREAGQEERDIAAWLKPAAGRLIAAINKTDAPLAAPDKTRAFLAEALEELPADRVIELSALKRDGLDKLLDKLFALAPEGPAPYPDDFYTDQTVDFRIAEIIREKAINRLRDEIPHALYVEVADTEFRDDGKRLWVRAFLVVERESQKGIVVGKGGSMIKAIRVAARKDLNAIFDWNTELDLRVKAAKDWRQNDAALKRLVD